MYKILIRRIREYGNGPHFRTSYRFIGQRGSWALVNRIAGAVRNAPGLYVINGDSIRREE